MDDLELIKMRLSRMPLEKVYRLSMDSGVAYGTLWHIKTGKVKNPRYKTVRKLADHFKSCPLAATCERNPRNKC